MLLVTKGLTLRQRSFFPSVNEGHVSLSLEKALSSSVIGGADQSMGFSLGVLQTLGFFVGLVMVWAEIGRI